MKKNKKFLSKFLGMLLASLTILSNINLGTAYAKNSKDVLLTIESYSVTDQQIVPGKEFELTLKIGNEGQNDSSKVFVDVINPDGVTPEYGTVTQKRIGKIKSGSSQEISFVYKASANLATEYVEFQVNISDAYSANTVPVRILVGSDSPFEIVSQNVPSEAVVNESTTANVSFQVLGNENVNDVVVMLKNQDDVIGSSSVGNLTAGATKSQAITFSIDEEGTYNIELCISYINSEGASSEMEIGSYSITVGENDSASYDATNSNVVSGEDGTIKILVGCVLLLGLGIVLVLMLKRKKK